MEPMQPYYSHYEYLRATEVAAGMVNKSHVMGLSENEAKELKLMKQRITAFELTFKI